MKTVDFVCCIRVLIVQNFQKEPMSIFSRHSRSSYFVTHNYRLPFFYRGLNEKPFGFENVLDGRIVDFFLALEY